MEATSPGIRCSMKARSSGSSVFVRCWPRVKGLRNGVVVYSDRSHDRLLARSDPIGNCAFCTCQRPFEAWPRRLVETRRFSRTRPAMRGSGWFKLLPIVALAGKSFAHEDALVPRLGAASGLLVPDGRIKVLILGHRPVRIEVNLAIAAPHRFG